MAGVGDSVCYGIGSVDELNHCEYLDCCRATVTAINTGEVWVKRSDGNKSKLYIAQLQKGKYTIRHVAY